MDNEDFDRMLEMVASAYETTPEQLRQNITDALEQEPNQLRMLTTPDGNGLSPLEAYVEYLSRTLPQPYDPSCGFCK